jgi:hypothetical protein
MGALPSRLADQVAAHFVLPTVWLSDIDASYGSGSYATLSNGTRVKKITTTVSGAHSPVPAFSAAGISLAAVVKG